jgi:hypothetical protein
VEWGFSEVRLNGVLRSSGIKKSPRGKPLSGLRYPTRPYLKVKK